MKNKLILLLIAIMLVFSAGVANAAYNLEIIPGGLVEVTDHSTVFFDVIFNSEDSVSLSTYTFNMYYDDSELTWNSGLTTLYAPYPLFSQMFGDLDGTTSGFIGNFNAGSFGGDATVSGSFTLAQLAFDVGSPALDGSPDVWFDTAVDSRYGFTVDGSEVLMSDMSILGTGPDVAIVPEPLSSALFVVGGVALGFRRLRKRVSG